jgi:hypothetical protein
MNRFSSPMLVTPRSGEAPRLIVQRRCTGVLLILGRFADRGELEHFVARAHAGAARDHGMRADPAARTDLDLRTDHRKGTDLDITR